MEDWEFDTTGVLRDILDKMEKDFNRLSLPSDILEPLNELTREFSKDNAQYTSLPTFSVSAKAELLDDTDDWWNLPLLKPRKPVSELLQKFERMSSRPIEITSNGYTTRSRPNEDRHRDDDNEFRKMRGCLYNSKRYRMENFCGNKISDAKQQNNNIEKDSGYFLPHISTFQKSVGDSPNTERSQSVPPQEYYNPVPLRPRSVPVDCFHYESLFHPSTKLRKYQTPEASQKSYEIHEKTEAIERPALPDSLLPIGPEIKIRDMVNSDNSSLDQMTSSVIKTKDNMENDVIMEKTIAGLMNVRYFEDNSISNNGTTEQLQQLLADLCSDAHRNSLPSEIFRKEDIQHRMDEEFRSESLPDIVRCDTRALNGRVPKFSFRSGNDLPWIERRQRIEAALSWLRSELELLRAHDKVILSQLQHCQETIDVIKKQKYMATYFSDEDEGHWEDWELAEFEKIWENNPETSESTGEDNSTGTIISVYELKPIGQPVSDIECSV